MNFSLKIFLFYSKEELTNQNYFHDQDMLQQLYRVKRCAPFCSRTGQKVPDSFLQFFFHTDYFSLVSAVPGLSQPALMIKQSQLP